MAGTTVHAAENITEEILTNARKEAIRASIMAKFVVPTQEQTEQKRVALAAYEAAYNAYETAAKLADVWQ